MNKVTMYLPTPIFKHMALWALLTIFATGICLVFLPQSAHAAEAKNFNAGHIIDDVVFYNEDSMTAAQIQTFLNSKVPACDTNGTQPASDWGRPDISHATLASYVRNGTNGYTK